MTTRCTLLAAIVSLGLLTAGAAAQGLPFPLPYGEDERDYAPAISLYDRDDYRPAAPRYDTVTTTRLTRYTPPAPVYEAAPVAAPAPVYQPVSPTFAPPVVTYRPVATTYVRPTITYTPVTYTPVTYAPVNYAPATYAPATCTPPVMTTYAPVAAAAPAPVATGPRVIVHPKVYVEGQPIRNLLKAITP